MNTVPAAAPAPVETDVRVGAPSPGAREEADLLVDGEDLLVEEEDLLVEEEDLLVEEVSIDGMCGVY